MGVAVVPERLTQRVDHEICPVLFGRFGATIELWVCGQLQRVLELSVVRKAARDTARGFAWVAQSPGSCLALAGVGMACKGCGAGHALGFPDLGAGRRGATSLESSLALAGVGMAFKVCGAGYTLEFPELDIGRRGAMTRIDGLHRAGKRTPVLRGRAPDNRVEQQTRAQTPRDHRKRQNFGYEQRERATRGST